MRRISTLVAIAIITSLAAATTSQAAAPVHERLSLDETYTWDFCGFPVEERIVAVLQFTTWFDDSGNRLRQIVTAPRATITWTNLATGASATTANPYVAHKRDNPDGSVTISFTGLVFALTGGGGRAHVDSGRDVVVFSENGFDLLSSVGRSADFCEGLSAAIG